LDVSVNVRIAVKQSLLQVLIWRCGNNLSIEGGKVIEEMCGAYDSYGRVFKRGLDDSFEWKMKWGDVVDLMFSNEGRWFSFCLVL
jgi:hypothetical protein